VSERIPSVASPGAGLAAGTRPAYSIESRRNHVSDRASIPSWDVIIYHNPACATSRNVLAMIRNAGIEPHVIEYLKTPPARPLLTQLVARMGMTARDALRQKEASYRKLGLEDPTLTDDQLIEAMAEHPILINRPIVVTPRGVRLCRPAETVLDILPPQRSELFNEDGERIVDPVGRPVRSA
jgi:arsenate reductase